MATSEMIRAMVAASAGEPPGDDFTPEQMAAYYRAVAELKEARKAHPKAHLWIPAATDGLPDAGGGGGSGGRGDSGDFHEEDHPRESSGKFASKGGEAKPKSSLGTVGKMREGMAKAQSAPKPKTFEPIGKKQGYNAAQEQAKAQAGREAPRAEYKQQLKENYGKPMSMGRAEYNNRMAAAAIRASDERHNTRSGLGPTDDEGKHLMNKYGYVVDPDAKKGTRLPGQQSMKGLSIPSEQRELHQRLEENLKNNARQGEHARPESEVVAEVHQAIAKEKAEAADREQRREAAKVAYAAIQEKYRPAREAADQKIKEADAKYQLAQAKYRELEDKERPKDQAGADAHEEKVNKAWEDKVAARNALEEAKLAKAEIGPPSPTRMSDEASRQALGDRQIVATKYLGGGVNSTQKVTFEDGTKGVFKAQEGEEPCRSNVDIGTYYLREAAASKVAGILGAEDLVPAVVRGQDMDGHVGSVHAWAEGDALGNVGASFDQRDSERMRVYDYITGNSDRHEMNVVVSPAGRPVLIDNGLSFPKGDPTRFLVPSDYMPSEPLSHETDRMIKQIDHTKLAVALAQSGLEHEAVRQTVARAEKLIYSPEILDLDHGHITYEPPDEEHLEHADKVLDQPEVKMAFQEGARVYQDSLREWEKTHP